MTISPCVIKCKRKFSLGKTLDQFMPYEIAALLHREDGKCTGYIYRASITINGVKYYAKDYGHRAFRIPIYA